MPEPRTQTNDLAKPRKALLSIVAVAELLDCSPRHVQRMVAANRMPRPVKLGTLVRWPSTTITEWIENGCNIEGGNQ